MQTLLLLHQMGEGPMKQQIWRLVLVFVQIVLFSSITLIVLSYLVMWSWNCTSVCSGRWIVCFSYGSSFCPLKEDITLKVETKTLTWCSFLGLLQDSLYQWSLENKQRSPQPKPVFPAAFAEDEPWLYVTFLVVWSSCPAPVAADCHCTRPLLDGAADVQCKQQNWSFTPAQGDLMLPILLLGFIL